MDKEVVAVKKVNNLERTTADEEVTKVLQVTVAVIEAVKSVPSVREVLANAVMLVRSAAVSP